MEINRKVFRVTLPSRDVEMFLAECEAVQWYGFDTGERIMTDSGPDAEAVLVVDATVVASDSVRVPIAQ